MTHNREMLGTLGAGLFTNSVWDMLSVIVPLYAVAVGLNAAEIGLVVAARSVLPAMLSIHGGILMDQLGTRRVLLWVAAGCTALPLLFPLSGWFTVLMLLQLLIGLASALGMAASQTWAMQISRGDTAQLGRYSVATRVGTFLGPVIVGAVWDFGGAWASFACVALCGAGIIYVAAQGNIEHRDSPNAPTSQGVAALLPRWEPHKQALLLALVPAVAFILTASFLRNAPNAIQASLFVVYLNGIGMSGTLIGVMIAIAELAGVFGSLFAAPAEKRLRADRLLIVCIAVSMASMAITPLIGSLMLVLVAVSVLRGIAQGMSQPLIYAILSSEIAGNRHGVSVGLRSAVVRLGSIITPAAMGFIAELWGLATSFYVIGAVVLLATVGLVIAARRMH